MSLYTSDQSMEDIQTYTRNVMAQQQQQQARQDVQMRSTNSMLSVTRNDTSKERYPGQQQQQFLTVNRPSSSLTTSSQPGGTMAQSKLVHQCFKYVVTENNLHQQDSLFTYICNPNFNYREAKSTSVVENFNQLPFQLRQQIKQPSQLKTFKSNDLLTNVKSIRIRILKEQQDSSMDVDDHFLLTNNPNIVLDEAKVPTSYLDPITFEIMEDPVQLPSGNIVDRTTIEKHFQNQYYTDPFSGVKITSANIQVHHTLKSEIQSFINEKKKRKRLLRNRIPQVTPSSAYIALQAENAATMGISYHTMYYLGCELVIFVFTLIMTVSLGIGGYFYYKNRGYPQADCKYSAFYWALLAFWMCSPLFILISTGFGGIHWIAAGCLMTVLWSTAFLTMIRQEPSYSSDKYHNIQSVRYLSTIKSGVAHLTVPLTILICVVFGVVAFTTTIFTYDLCIGIHPVRVSTYTTRQIQGPSCPPGTVCNFILTVPEDLTTSIIANFHSNDKADMSVAGFAASFALVDTVSHASYFGGRKSIEASDFVNPYPSVYGASSFEMDTIEEQRYIHWADVVNLQPATTYYVVVGYQSEGTFYFFGERKFRTAPNDTTPFNFVSGGDMSYDEHGLSLQRLAAADEPLFAMVGGDVAYDNGFFCCYRIWDDWFVRWDAILVTASGYSIPIITTIGNHEAGGWRSTSDAVPFYTRYMPYQLGLGQLASPDDRPTYHSHSIGPKVFVVAADSDVISTIESQNEWIDNQLGNSSAEFKFAIYHIAIYPCTSVSSDEAITQSAKDNWAPIFDRHNLTVALENHYHLYKRSKQLKAGVEDPNGTLYIGDGAWGATTILKVKSYDYIAASSKTQHMLKLAVSPTNHTVAIRAINIDGNDFDNWNRKMEL
eukprot:gene16777-19950_t